MTLLQPQSCQMTRDIQLLWRLGTWNLLKSQTRGQRRICEISGSHGAEYKDHSLPGYSAV